MASSQTPPQPNGLADPANPEATALTEILQRLTVIERNQSRLSEELLVLQGQAAKAATNGVNGHGKEREIDIALEGEPEPVDLAKSLEDLSKKVDGLADSVKLDQQRLWARLMNSRIKQKKEGVKPVIGNNGKPPPNYPGTKGEFEHVTKERYEEWMKAYGLPIKGDTNAKREVVREFLGLPPLQ